MWTVLDECKVSEEIDSIRAQFSLATVCVVGKPCSSVGEIRLIGGVDQFQGRVEVCTTALVFSTVCSIGWDNIDAQVVCRQLGLGGTLCNCKVIVLTDKMNV